MAKDRRFVRVCLGGTFDVLHAGHRRLLEQAFEAGKFVFIGLSSDELANSARRRKVAPWPERRRRLDRFIRGRWPSARYEIGMIGDVYGGADTGEFDAIIVSDDTLAGARKINRRRKAHGLPALAVVSIGMVLAEDSMPISSSRIRSGELDPEGRLVRGRAAAIEGGRMKDEG